MCASTWIVQIHVKDCEPSVPGFSVSFSLAVPFLKTRSAFLRVHSCRRPIFHSRRPFSATIFFLLISGDVEVSPGPTDNQPALAATNSQPVPAAGSSHPVPAAQSIPATANSSMFIFNIIFCSVIFCYLRCRYGVSAEDLSQVSIS